MKGRFLKKLTAGALALLMVSGGVPMQPIADYLSPVITASAQEQDPVTYIGADGEEETITDYTLVTSYHYGTQTQMWSGGNYVVNDDVTIKVNDNDAIYFDGFGGGYSANLILCDGAHLTVTATGYDCSAFAEMMELNIFAQSTGEDKGELTAEGDIGIDCESLNVYGGKVTLNGSINGLCLQQRNEEPGLTVNGGEVEITRSGAIGFSTINNNNAGGHLTVNGGTLTVSASSAVQGDPAISYIGSIALNGGTADITGDIYDFSTLDLNGGNVAINGSLVGASSTAADNVVTLGYTSPTDTYMFSDLTAMNPNYDFTVKVAENKGVTADGTTYTGTLTDDQRSAISGKNITPVSCTVSIADGITGGTVEADKTGDVLCGDTVTLTVTPDEGYLVKNVKCNGNEIEPVGGVYSFMMPAEAVTVSAEFEEDTSYFDSETGKLTLKGNILNSEHGIVLPDGVDPDEDVDPEDILSIDVDSRGATLPEDSSSLFEYCVNVRSIDLTGADTSGVTNMSIMFAGCMELTSLELGDFDTSSVTNMSGMFTDCCALTTLDVSGFDTSSVTDISDMFHNCSELTSLDVSGFDTSSATNMTGMFVGCSKLTSLDVSGFDTSSVKHMVGMFMECSELTSLDLSGFATSNVRGIGGMFSSCTNLTTIYVGEGWITQRVTDSNGVFTGCTNLTGGNGTACNGSNNIDADYAVIDKEGQPGYLTGVYTLTLPDNIEIAADANEDEKFGDRYFIDAVVTLRCTDEVQEGYLLVVKANGTELTAENGVYTLTMPDSNVTVTVESEFSDGVGAHLAGNTLILGDDIGVSFYMELADSVISNSTAKMVFTIPDGGSTTTIVIPVSDIVNDPTKCVTTTDGKTYYIFPCHIAAKEMTSAIMAKIVYTDNGEEKEGTEYTYSVKQYADYIIEHPDEYGEKAVNLVKAMLYYGGAAQKLLVDGVSDEELASYGLSFDPLDLPAEGFTTCDLTKITTEGLTLKSISLVLLSKTTLRLYFASTTENLPVLIDSNGNVYTAKQKDGMYYYDITDFTPGEIFAKRSVMFADNENAEFDETKAFDVCLGNYANWALGGTDENLKATIRALYNYDEYAKSYNN